MNFSNKLLQITQLSIIFKNLTYIAVLELFYVVSPFITYPYLIRILGTDMYGWVITAQVISSYAVIFINFGFNSISAKDIAIHRDNKARLSEILSNILIIRVLFWIFSFILYFLVISIIPSYNKHISLFVLSFGITFNELLFPQFYFQGIERMKYITFINLSISITFMILIFLFVKNESDYILVPLFKSVGFLIGGVISLYVIFLKHKIKFILPRFKIAKLYLKEALPIFSTEIITSIKDKFSYILLSSFLGMQEVVIYDFGAKITAALSKPASILSRVLLPKIAMERNVLLLKKATLYLIILMIFGISIFNILLPKIAAFFIPSIHDLNPLRLFSLAPLFLTISSFIASSGIIALGFNKYIFYSIIVTTFIYITNTTLFYYTSGLSSVYYFILITVIAYFAELVYRLFVIKNILRNEKSRFN